MNTNGVQEYPDAVSPIAAAMGETVTKLMEVATSEGSRAERHFIERIEEGKEHQERVRDLQERLGRAEAHRRLLLEKMREIQPYLRTLKARVVEIQSVRPGPAKRTNLRKVMQRSLPDAVIEIDTCTEKMRIGIEGPEDGRPMGRPDHLR